MLVARATRAILASLSRPRKLVDYAVVFKRKRSTHACYSAAMLPSSPLNEIASVQNELLRVQTKIDDVEKQIEDLTAAIKDLPVGSEEWRYLRDKEQSLRNEKQSLRNEKLSLRNEKLKLMDKHKNEVEVKVPPVNMNPELTEYIKTGSLIKSRSDIMQAIERDVDAVFQQRDLPSMFLYSEGSSGIGKSQLAFNFQRKVVYLPMVSDQSVYTPFDNISAAVIRALRDDKAVVDKLFNPETFASYRYSAWSLNRLNVPLHSVSVLLGLVKLSMASQSDDTSVFLGGGSFTSKPMEIAEGLAAIREIEASQLPLFFIDEVPSNSERSLELFELCLLLRNILRSMQLVALLSGTESSLINVMATSDGSRVSVNDPWVRLYMKLPDKFGMKVDVKGGSFESRLLGSTRPLFVKWFEEGCKALQEKTLSPNLVTFLKVSIMSRKPIMGDPQGLIGQVAFSFSGSSSSYSAERGKLKLRHHFAMLELAPPYNESHMITLYNVDQKKLCINGDPKHEFKPGYRFDSPEEDELLYLSCLRNGLFVTERSIPNKVVTIPVPSSYVLRIVNDMRLESHARFGNKNAKKNDGHDMEQEALIAFVSASHYYETFDGMKFSEWLARVVYELCPEKECEYEGKAIKGFPDGSDLDFRVGLLAPPGTSWSKKSPSPINYGTLTWSANQEQRDGVITSKANDMKVWFELKDYHGGFGGVALAKVAEKFVHGRVAAPGSTGAAASKGPGGGSNTSSSKGVCILICSKLNQPKDETKETYPALVNYYKIHSSNGELRCTALKSSQGNEKHMFIVALEDIYPERTKLMQHQT
jgi:hypothetical protein